MQDSPAKEHVLELLRRGMSVEDYARIRHEWKTHSIAEDRRDIAGLLSTLTDDCVYQIAGTGHEWRGHAGATAFYTGLLTAFPDIRFELTDIVIGPQGVCEEANVTATHMHDWLSFTATGCPVSFTVVIFFPWDPVRGKFRGEKVHIAHGSLGPQP